jgi:5S rRNA maturation endonuclease (ribonuclease M5)
MIFIDQYKNCYTIDFRPTKSKYICPVCGTLRKNKKDRSLYINRNTKIGKCFNCDAVLFEHKETDNIVKEYKQPKELKTKLSKSVIDYFSKRGISESSLNYLKVTNGLTFMPQTNTDVNTIDFNYYKSDKIINIKHRDNSKNFKFETDCEVTFYNFDAVYNFEKIIIVEGEIDALSFIEAGLMNVVSLPNGCKNTKFIDQYIFDIEKVKEWVLCLDKDEGGLSARFELLSKLGIEKCKIINTKDCKDANSFLVKHGKKELVNAYNLAESLIENKSEFDFNMITEESNITDETKTKPYTIILGQPQIGFEYGKPAITEMLTSGNLSMIKGKSKSRKTFSIMMLCKLVLSNNPGFVNNSENGVILFDTEQFKHHSIRFYKRLSEMGADVSIFRMYNLRAYNKEQRLQFIKTYIEKYTPSLAIIDNVRDVIRDFNDIGQSDDIITMLSNLMETTGTHICCTLHENKGDANARGHLGSELTQKAETVFGIETTENVTTISPDYCRNKEFEAIKFEIIDNLPKLITDKAPF